MVAGRVAVLLMLAGAAMRCQDLRVYSEWTRLDPLNRIVRADRGSLAPREILSPALPRNGYSTFRVVVSGPPGTAYTLHAGMNPENAVGLSMYLEHYRDIGGESVPDGIESIALPYQGQIGPAAKAQSFLMDLRVDRRAPVARIKVEPQVWMIDRWIAYPMEARVVEATVPDGAVPAFDLPAPSLPSDATAAAIFHGVFCEANRSAKSRTATASTPELTGRALAARNAGQEARAAKNWSIQVPEQASWCEPYRKREAGPEWYLRVRDRIWRARER